MKEIPVLHLANQNWTKKPTQTINSTMYLGLFHMSGETDKNERKIVNISCSSVLTFVGPIQLRRFFYAFVEK